MIANVGRALHFGDKRVRRILNLAHNTTGLTHHLWQLVRAKEQEREDGDNHNIRDGKHAERPFCRPSSKTRTSTHIRL